MGNKILYILLFAWVKVNSILPMPVLYLFSDILYFFVYHVGRYRRKVVRTNLINSFPDKTEKEIKNIECRFYHFFADYFVETIKIANIRQKELAKHAIIKNPEVIFDLIDKGHSCFILTAGHYGNWELFSASGLYFQGRASLDHVYRPLKNKAFDKLFIYLRTRFNSPGIKKDEVARTIVDLKRNKSNDIVTLVADQTPSKKYLEYWATFLNQDSAILLGPEKLAKKFDIPILFADMIRVKRGYYTVDLKLITDNPKDTPDYFITDEFVRLMNACIMRDPAFWLWTHKRWKHKRVENGELRVESVNSM